MIKKYYLIASLLLFITGLAKAQYEQPYNLYNFEPVMINPATAGHTNDMSAFFNFRKQWVGFEGAPESLFGAVQGKVMENMGLALVFTNTKSTVFSTLHTGINYAYTLQLSDNMFITPGVYAGIKKNSLHNDNLSDALLADVSITSNEFNKTYYSLGFGMRFKMDNLVVDFAVPQLASGDTKRMAQQLLGYVAYSFYTANDTWRIQPSVLYRNFSGGENVNIKVSNLIDYSFLLEYKKTIWAQTSYRNNSDVQLMLGFKYSYASIAYAYEVTNSILENVSHGSHEIALRVNIPGLKK